MVHSAPVDELDLVATSVADDAAFVALGDASLLLARPGFEKALLIGGHMVSLHARRFSLRLSRETQDADLGFPQLALNTTDVVPALAELGYRRVRSNRFEKTVSDADGGSANGHADVRAVIDILVPALTSHARKNVKHGDVTTIEVPGLAEALNRVPVVVGLNLTRRNGEVLTASLRIPDERSALVLKALAWDARGAAKDAIDVWRCLEIAHVAGVRSDDFESSDGNRAMIVLDTAFGSEAASGTVALGRALGLSETATGTQATRLRALVGALRR